jgi:hypothetical protein
MRKEQTTRHKAPWELGKGSHPDPEPADEEESVWEITSGRACSDQDCRPGKDDK